MKTMAAVLGIFCVGQVFAGDGEHEHGIDSEVIHDYSLIQPNYIYLHDIGNSDVDGHGAGLSLGYDWNNVLFLAEGGYVWGVDDDLGIDADLEAWDVSGSVGYAIRLMDNHINIIPRVGVAYGEVTIDSPLLGEDSEDDTFISPGITVSYAICNWWSVHGGYSFDYGFDSEEESHSFFAGSTVAFTERLGLTVRGAFREGEGFTGILAGVGYHF